MSSRASAAVKRLGREVGFDLVRIAPAADLGVERERYLQWVRDGRQGEMRWITEERAARAADPRCVLPNARSVVCVGLAYGSGLRAPNGPGTGKLARYAWGQDYHAVLGDRLRCLAGKLEAEMGGEHRWYVDTGPLMDKALAARSGLGWYGKNTNILTERFGSFVLLGELVTTLELEPDPPLEKNCGSCRLCVVACPTGALGPDYTIDSRKCISYLTIEHRGPIPRHLRPAIGDWVFGCDICQDVCPPTMQPFLSGAEERRAWAKQVRRQVSRADDNVPPSLAPPLWASKRSPTPSPLFRNGTRAHVDLLWLLGLSHEDYVEAFRGTSIKRAKVWMLRRNAAVALGNVGDVASAGALHRAMRCDDHPLVRGHAAWAFTRLAGRIGLTGAEAILREALDTERDEGVREEIQAGIEEL